MSHTGMSYPTNNADGPCRRDLKLLLAKKVEQKQWLVDNQETIHQALEVYEKFYEALGRAEMDIIRLKREIVEEKKAKKLAKKKGK